MDTWYVEYPHNEVYNSEKEWITHIPQHGYISVSSCSMKN